MAWESGMARPRAHVLLAPADLASHTYVYSHIMYLLSNDSRYAGRTIVTAFSGRAFKAEVEAMAAQGALKGVDLRIEPGVSVNLAEITGSTILCDSARDGFQPLRQRLLRDKEIEGSEPVTSIICDMFFPWLKDVADELGAAWYPIYPCGSVYALGCLLGPSEPKLELRDPANVEVRSKPIPELPFARVHDLPLDIFSDPEFFKFQLERVERATAVLINQARELDAYAPLDSVRKIQTIWEPRATAENRPVTRILSIGPIAKIEGFGKMMSTTCSSTTSECLRWLDMQPPTSVLYIAFGTVINIGPHSMLELAHALQSSGVRFLWVLRLSEAYDVASVLPPDFNDRTKGRGFVERGFAPQAQILEHPSVGSFMTHCGWNSILESLCAGVPIIPWPVALDQPMTARIVTNVWKVGWAMKSANEDYNNVGREDLEKAIRMLMMDQSEQVEEIKRNIKYFKRMLSKTRAKGGSSYQALHSFLDEISEPLNISN